MHSACPLVGIGTLPVPTPLSPASVPLPPEHGRLFYFVACIRFYSIFQFFLVYHIKLNPRIFLPRLKESRKSKVITGDHKELYSAINSLFNNLKNLGKYFSLIDKKIKT